MMKLRQASLVAVGAIAIASLVLLFPASAKADGHHHHGDDDAATTIGTCGYLITSPGRYVLASNLDCSGDGITIEASHVELDLDGHTLSGLGSSYGGGFGGGGYGGYGGYGSSNTGILVSPSPSGNPLSDVQIEGPGTVSQFLNGIDLENLSDSSVHDVTSTDNAEDGLVTNYDFSSTVSRLRLTDNVVSGNDAWNMILDNIYDSQIRQNATALCALGEGEGVFGIAILGGSGNLVQDNVSTGNFGGGIDLDTGATPATNNEVRDNVASGNTIVGIEIQPGNTGNLIEGNEVFGNVSVPDGQYDVEDANPCGANTWRHNEFGTSNEACIVSTTRGNR